MDWLPKTPDELAGAIVIIVIVGALGLVLLGRLVLWVAGWAIWRPRSVKSSSKGGAGYVENSSGGEGRSAPFHQEREREREREPAERPADPPPPLDGKLYTAEQLQIITTQAWEAGAAEALGRLLGRQFVAGDERADAMELLFGPRGRRHQRVRPLVDAAAAAVAPAAAEARLVPVNDGDRGHVEL